MGSALISISASLPEGLPVLLFASTFRNELDLEPFPKRARGSSNRI
jgi:hypothetical protein